MKKDLFKFYQTYNIYIFSGVIFFSCIILIVYVIYPQITKLLSNQKIEREVLKRIDFLEVKAQALEGYQSEDLSSKVKFALVSYPADKDFASIIGIIQNLSASSGFNIVILDLSTSSQGTGANLSYNIKLEAIGPVKRMQGFLDNIEKFPRLIRVNSIQTSNSSGDSITISLSLDILYSPVGEDFGSVDSPIPDLTEREKELLAKLPGLAPSLTSGLSSTSSALPRGKSNPFE